MKQLKKELGILFMSNSVHGKIPEKKNKLELTTLMRKKAYLRKRWRIYIKTKSQYLRQQQFHGNISTSGAKTSRMRLVSILNSHHDPRQMATLYNLWSMLKSGLRDF